MNITEEQKQEADNVVSNIISKTKESLGSMVFSDFGYNHLGVTLAIQNRQSVLDENNSVFEMLKIHGDLRTRLPIHERIQSLTNQIDYLKSKI